VLHKQFMEGIPKVQAARFIRNSETDELWCSGWNLHSND